ncbi:MAG: hypothetical protein LBI13_07515 [Streptococcaceae bacterium]|jgi:hypothetical protein|nr:hypothetical protein [Streptococcaceae bacterium]
MGYTQLLTPSLNIGATAGWCQAYVDNAIGNTERYPTALATWQAMQAKGVTRTGNPPVGVWVPIWFGFNTGDCVNYGHVAWAFNHGDGRTEIHDSEVHRGARAPYQSIQELLNWFGAQALYYLGWALADGNKTVVSEDGTSNAGSATMKGRKNMFLVRINTAMNYSGSWGSGASFILTADACRYIETGDTLAILNNKLGLPTNNLDGNELARLLTDFGTASIIK